MSSSETVSRLSLILFICSFVFAQYDYIQIGDIPYKIYPEVNDLKPGLSSPFKAADNEEYIIAVTKENKYAIAPVTLSNENRMCKQLFVDSADFPALSKTGLHSEKELIEIKFITGRSIEEITELGRPNRLSQAGFMAEDETVLSVIKGDNQLVRAMDLTHPQLAAPLFHILNLMDIDLSLNRWNMAKHRWENIKHILYNDQKVYVEAEDTKGGQKSIFNDGIGGSFYIKIWRMLSAEEEKFLEEKYGHLSESDYKRLKDLLSTMNTGEMEPQYIMRYGFYEGHTYWRTDPIALAFIFGLRTLPEIEEKFAGRLFETLTTHFTEQEFN